MTPARPDLDRIKADHALPLRPDVPAKFTHREHCTTCALVAWVEHLEWGMRSLASMEAFEYAGAIPDTPLGHEVQARIAFALGFLPPPAPR